MGQPLRAYDTTAGQSPASAGPKLRVTTPLPERSYQQTREELVREHGSLVKKHAYRIAQRVPSHVLVEDLISAGMVGLLGAVDRYDSSKGPFPAYAEWRIKGAILDELRDLDRCTRTERRNIRSRDQAIRRLELQLGRAPEPEEIRAEMGVSERVYEGIRAAEERSDATDHDAYSTEKENTSGSRTSSHHADVLVTEEPSPEAVLLRGEAIERVREEVAGLPERTRQMLELYYVDGLNYADIGRIFGITESRISQIFTRGAGPKLAERLQNIR